MDSEAITIWNLINTGGMVALLFVNLWLLLRGDILPRKVYEELTTKILNELCARVISGVRKVIREEVTGKKEEEG